MKSKLSEIKCFLLDMDGTVHLSGKAFDGAAEAIERMRKQGRVLFITNSVWFSRESQAEKLRAMGIPADAEDVFTAGVATAEFLKKHHPNKTVYVLGTEVLKNELVNGGIKIISPPVSPDLVVVSFDDKLDFKKLTKTCDFIRAGIPFLVTHPDFNYPIAGGYLPDAGANLALIYACTSKMPFAICGKPHETMGEIIRSVTGCNPAQVAMFGDRLMTDMVFAENNGFVSVLVLSGEATREDLEKSDVKVDVVLRSIAEWDF